MGKVERNDNHELAGGSMRFLLALLGVLATTLLVEPASPGSAQIQPPELKVEVVPTSVDLAPQFTAGPGDPADVELTHALVIIRNPSADHLRQLRLSTVTNASVTVRLDGEPVLAELAPHGEFAWSLVLSQSREGPIPGTVTVRVDYIWQAQGDAKGTPRVAIGALEVRSRQREAVTQLVDVEVKSALVSLNDQQAGTIYVVLTNKSDIPLRVRRIKPEGPTFLAFEPNAMVNEILLTPRDSRHLAFDVRAANAQVRPGKHLLLFVVAFEWQRAGERQSGDVIATREIEVKVLGESEVLTPLAVPSLLVLPGFLVLTMWSLLWTLFRPKDSQAEFPLKVSSPYFWMVAIPISFAIVFGYPFASKLLFNIPRDYFLGNYGLIDVAWVWLASLLLGSVGYLLATGVAGLIRWARQAKEAWRTPSPRDLPVTTLRKLHRQGLGLNVKRIQLKVGDQPQTAYLLERPSDSQEEFWASRGIVFGRPSNVVAKEDLEGRIESQLTNDGNPTILAELLEEGQRSNYLYVDWEQSKLPKGPFRARRADASGELQDNLIIRRAD
jgi:hypothetical protein